MGSARLRISPFRQRLLHEHTDLENDQVMQDLAGRELLVVLLHVDQTANPRLFDALARPDTMALECALRAPGDPDAVNDEGVTPLLLAADAHLVTSLYAAANSGHVEVVRFLAEAGADRDA